MNRSNADSVGLWFPSLPGKAVSIAVSIASALAGGGAQACVLVSLRALGARPRRDSDRLVAPLHTRRGSSLHKTGYTNLGVICPAPPFLGQQFEDFLCDPTWFPGASLPDYELSDHTGK